MKKKLIIICGLALQFLIAQAQIELGMGVGKSVYRGEIAANMSASNYVVANVIHGGVSTQAFAKFSIYPGIKLRVNAGYSEYSAFDKYSRDTVIQNRNLSVNGKIFDAGLMVEYYPISVFPLFITSGLKFGTMEYVVSRVTGEVVGQAYMNQRKSLIMPVGFGFDVLKTARGTAVSFEMVTNAVNGDVLEGMNTVFSRNTDYYTSITMNYRVLIGGSEETVKKYRSNTSGEFGRPPRTHKHGALPKRKYDACPTF